MFGSHLSVAGGLHNALIEAHEKKMDCVQVFTKNQRQWKTKPLTDEQITLWQKHRKQTDIHSVVSHDSYLINLASPDPVARDKSIALFREELLRCETLDIPLLVTHPGAHMKEGEEAGLKQIIASLDEVHRDLPGLKTITCLETTAGQGTSLGWRFEHLQVILQGCHAPARLAVCLDTAHMFAAGYDMTSQKGTQAMIQELDQLVGLDQVRAIHLNDSKIERGGRVDRHEHIGHGHIAKVAFEWLLSEPAFGDIPKILETAKSPSPNGEPWDLVNLKTLRQMQKRGFKKRNEAKSQKKG